MKLYQNKRPVKNREMFDFDSTSSSDYNIKKKNMIWEQKHKDKMEIHRKQLELKRKEIEAKALHVKQKIEEDRLRIKEVMKKQRIELEKRRMDTVNEKKAEEAQIKFVLDYINNEFTKIQKDLKNISFKTYT